MSAGNPPELAEKVINQGFTKAAGVRVVHLEPGKVELALPRRDDLLQFAGHFHGGVIAALADQAAGMAVTSKLPRGKIGAAPSGWRRSRSSPRMKIRNADVRSERLPCGPSICQNHSHDTDRT